MVLLVSTQLELATTKKFSPDTLWARGQEGPSMFSQLIVIMGNPLFPKNIPNFSISWVCNGLEQHH